MSDRFYHPNPSALREEQKARLAELRQKGVLTEEEAIEYLTIRLGDVEQAADLLSTIDPVDIQ